MLANDIFPGYFRITLEIAQTLYLRAPWLDILAKLFLNQEMYREFYISTKKYICLVNTLWLPGIFITRYAFLPVLCGGERSNIPKNGIYSTSMSMCREQLLWFKNKVQTHSVTVKKKDSEDCNGRVWGWIRRLKLLWGNLH